MRNRALLAALAAALLAVLLFFVSRMEGPRDLPAADWRIFRSQFISSAGRVIDTGNGDISHSEGQGYGMLIAEAYGDRKMFDQLWSWTRENLQVRPEDKLLCWLWKPTGDDGQGTITDPNNASDGDLLVAWALVRASKRWETFDYNRAALEILVDLARQDIIQIKDQRFLLPGTEGFRRDDGTVLNPSYTIFPALRELGAEFPGGGWAELIEPGEDLLRTARFGAWQLAPEWVLLDDKGRTFLPQGFRPDFGYNAVRIPLYVAWHNPSSPLLEPFATFWASFPELSEMPATVDLLSGDFGPHPSLPGMQAVAQLTLAAFTGKNLAIKDIAPVPKDVSYYSACLTILVKIAIRESLLDPAGDKASS